MPIDQRVFFVYTKGNKIINDMLAAELHVENLCQEQLCEDGGSRPVWRCSSYEFLENFLERVKGEIERHKFDIYVRLNPDEPLSLWPYDDTIPRPRANRKNRRSRIRDIVSEEKALLGVT